MGLFHQLFHSLGWCLLLIAQSTADQANPDLILSQGFVRNGDPEVGLNRCIFFSNSMCEAFIIFYCILGI